MRNSYRSEFEMRLCSLPLLTQSPQHSMSSQSKDT